MSSSSSDSALELFKAGKYSDAEYAFKLECKTEPNFDNWYYRALCFKYQKMYESALRCFLKATQFIDKGEIDLKILYQIGFSHYYLGNYRKAAKYMEKWQEFQSDHKLSQIIEAMSWVLDGNRKEFEESLQNFYQRLSPIENLNLEI